MFPAGHYWTKGILYQYWALPEESVSSPSDEELEWLVRESVALRMRADVPVGAYLSGGLDSTLVVGLAGRPLDTWSVGFSSSNEFEWAQLAADRFSCVHHNVEVALDEFPSDVKWMVEKRREPLSVPNEVLLYRLNRLVNEKNTVCLSGEGADELFFGYDRIFRWARTAPRFDVGRFSELYSYGSHEDLEIVDDVLSPFMHRKTPLEVVSHFFQIAHLHGLLRRLDNASMLSSVEARVPFADHHPLIERMAGVSMEFRNAENVVKAPLKRVFKGILPPEIIERKKVGFPVPLEAMSFNTRFSGKPMDCWLNFNLSILGIEAP
jgi:asparagine synthase (glutamine-hydrolysing)